MPKISVLKYEFSDYDEAQAAIRAWSRAPIGNPDSVPYPKFEIDYIDIEHEGIMTVWVKLKAEE